MGQASEAVAHIEVELKYEATSDLVVPGEWSADLRVTDTAEHRLRAVYFDTPDRRLGAAGVALRRREGGADAGWHLKRRIADETQHEQLWPYQDSLPEEAAQALEDVVPQAIEHLRIIADISTHRTAYTLSNAAGVPLIEIADDRVTAVDRSRSMTRAWREWEAEVLDENFGDRELRARVLNDIREVFVAAGARKSLADSKIARAASALLPAALLAGADDIRLAALSVQDTADRIAGTVAEADEAGDAGSAAAQAARQTLYPAATADTETQERADRLRRLAWNILENETLAGDSR